MVHYYGEERDDPTSDMVVFGFDVLGYGCALVCIFPYLEFYILNFCHIVFSI